MNFSVERGKHIAAGFGYVDFVLHNSDIMAAISNAPLRIRRVSPDKYSGTIFGISIKIECIDSKRSRNQGSVLTLSDVCLPLNLGATYAKTSQSYCAIDDNTTSIELKLELQARGLLSVYARLRRTAVTNYIDRVCGDIERAAQTIVSGNYRSSTQLSDEQKARIEEFVANVPKSQVFGKDISNTETLEASVNIAVVKNMAVVQADAVMPDRHFVTAKNELSHDAKKHQSFQASADILGRINNPASVTRGEKDNRIFDIDFRQAAFEFGHNLFKEYFSGNLAGVMPMLSYHGKQTFLRFAFDERLESLPWEALHDGKDFLATKVRFARSLGTAKIHLGTQSTILEDFGILLVGSDSRGDLPGTAIEVETIGKLLAKAGTNTIEVLTGAQANRQNVIDAISKGKFNVFHFSGHSVFNAQYPYQSYLELAQGSKLYLHELDQINTGTGGANPFNLIFLNSCQSGRTAIDQTSGRSMSLCRVLREAGVDNVIGMLWNVTDDVAAQVASTFYGYLASGKYSDVSEALRQTRSKVAIDRAWQDGSWLAPVLYA